jgi:molybdate transport system permease protein
MLDLKSLILTVKLAGIVTPFLVIAVLPAAYLISFTRFKGQKIVEAALNLPLFIPPTVLGFFLLIMMGPDSFPGSVYEKITGSRLIFSFEGLVLALMISNIPFAVQPVLTAFRKLDKRLIEASQMLGFNRFKTFILVVVPNSVSGIASSAALVFSHCLGEFGVVLMVGGSVPGETKTASVSIFESVEMLDYSGAFKMSFILLAAGFFFSFLITGVLKND